VRRRVLLVYPKFAANNLLAYEHTASFYVDKRAVMPPLGLLILGARLLAEQHLVRLVDENVRPLTGEDLEWAEVVGFSAMHPQRRRVTELIARANRLGKLTMLGGPSANICPEYYPQVDLLHVGELGDATDGLLEYLRSGAGKPRAQVVFKTTRILPLDEQPMPARSLIDVNAYLVQPVQFSVGCPFSCEFCDIPIIYGRVARLKSGPRVVRELEAVYQSGFVGTILFVDDNLIANHAAVKAMLTEVGAWQRKRGFPYPLTGEASIDLARDKETLRLLQAARFTHMFVGVESPDPETLKTISKRQNVMDPLLESLRVLQAHGLEPILGMIFGFDTDRPDTAEAVMRFVAEARAPIVYFNLLGALPKTPLWHRLEREGRLLADAHGDQAQSDALLSCMATNVRFALPNDAVRAALRRAVREVYSPREVFRRFTWIVENVHPAQLQGQPPHETRGQQAYLARFAATALWRVMTRMAVSAELRHELKRFVRALRSMKRRGLITSVLQELILAVPNAYHLITWGQTLLADEQGQQAEARAAHWKPAPAAAVPPPRPPAMEVIDAALSAAAVERPPRADLH